MNRLRGPQQYHNLKFDEAITTWDEAIMLGNGHVGCLIWGESSGLRFSLDRGDLWDTTVYPGIHSEEFTYKKLVELAHKKDTDTIRRIFDSPYYNTTPTKLPAGKIILHFEEGQSICSELDLKTASGVVTVGGAIQIKSYLHATNQSGFIQIHGDIPAGMIELVKPDFGTIDEEERYTYDATQRSISKGSLQCVKYKQATWYKEEGIQYFVQETTPNTYYAIILGSKKVVGGTEISYRVVTHTGEIEEWIATEVSILKQHLEQGYDEAFKSHCEWWEAFWNKSDVQLPDPFFEQQWYLTNYFLGSASRKGAMPMPLQGVWTADDGALPPWKGDYHNDLNTQMTYYHYLKANHLEEGEAFIDFLWNLVPTAREFAKSFYDAEGICLPAVMSIDGTALGGWPMYSLSPTQHLWLCQAFERHYRFSGDKTFLVEKAYPFLKESAQCILSLLKENKEGFLELPVSSSSEIHDDTGSAWLTPNSNYDQSIMMYLFRSLKALAGELENGEEATWDEVLNKLAPLAVSPHVGLLLSSDEALEESHRHHAHAMAIHPLRLLDYNKPEDKRVVDTTVGRLEQLGTGWWTGYSFSWFAEFLAVQGNGEGAYYQLRLFWENFCSPNGFHINGDYKCRGLSNFHYRPFTLEGNFCAADTLQEMLVQTDYGSIDLFPAIPKAWTKECVSFEDFRGEKGLLISATCDQGQVSSVTLKPKHTGVYKLKGKINALELIEGSYREEDILILYLEGGKVYTISQK